MLTKAEVNYSITKKECLPIIWTIKHFRYYLVGALFEVLTDHHSLEWLCPMKGEDALLT